MAGDRELRILSVDGGGMRGLVPALLLQEIERRLHRKTGEERPLSDYFHLFAGTSTGGLIALGLTAPSRDDPARPSMDASQLVDLYRRRRADPAGPALAYRPSARTALVTRSLTEDTGLSERTHSSPPK